MQTQSQQAVDTSPQQGRQAQTAQTDHRDHRQQGETIVIQTGNCHRGSASNYDHYHSRTSVILGIVLISLGCLLIVLNAIAMVIKAEASFTGHGIWGGFWHILTGVFGFWAGRSKNLCQILNFMIFAILSALMAVVGLVLFAVGASIDNNRNQYNIHRYEHKSPRVAVNAMAAMVSAIASVVSIVCAVLCCHGICCGRSAPQSFTIAQEGSSDQPTQVVYVPANAARGGVASGVAMEPVSGSSSPRGRNGQPVSAANDTDVEPPPDYATAMEDKLWV